jgi:acyl carrier protein
LIREFVWQQFPAAKRHSIGDGESLLASGIVDSLGVLDVVQFLEEKFGLMLSDEDMLSENFETIASIAEFVAGQLEAECAVNQS